LKLLVVLLTFTLGLSACRKEEAPKPRTEPWLNPAYGAASTSSGSAPSPAAPKQKYALDPAASRVSFSLPAKGGTPRGTLSQASGTLEFDALKPADSRAELTFDLTSVSLEPWGEGAADSSVALDWLELGADVASAVREQHRRATFVLSKLTGFAEGLHEPGGKSFGSARGELSLHGFRVPLELSLEVERREGVLLVRTRKPVAIKLAEHDIVPRGPSGERRSQELSLIGTKVGKEIKVECELAFRSDRL
jgi:hypothetical protein